MTAMSGNGLHLPNLTIRGFRGIQDLSMERLGRVTLIAGKNGVGKTTVLDAVRAYAARGKFSVITSILNEREELLKLVDDTRGDLLAPDWDALCYGRRLSPDSPITIGPTGSDESLTITNPPLSNEEARRWTTRMPGHDNGEARLLKITFAGKEQVSLLFSSTRHGTEGTWTQHNDYTPSVPCESLGPSVLSNARIGRFWDEVALTDDENRAVEALRLVFGDTIKRVAVIGDDQSSGSRSGRRIVVRVAGQERPVPLRSLGDGAVRLFGVALALANSQGGFLLIDEAENGIHYSLQRDFWRMVLLTAHENNVQVFATTHSWDCAAGFARAAVEAEGVEGALVRLDSDGENIRAVEYSERQLHVAAEQGIEVR